MNDAARCPGSHMSVAGAGLQTCPQCGQGVLAVKRWGSRTPILNTHSKKEVPVD